jgi:hypothetical protein
MPLPVIRGTIQRRLLVNYRVDPAVLARQLPSPFVPKIQRGQALVGICLIRLADVRPTFLPAWCGIGSENAAHRAAVAWDDDAGQRREGVYIRRRDTNSRLNALAGGRVFPGVHHHARFDVNESPDAFSIEVTSDDGAVCVSVKARLVPQWPGSAVFNTLAEASQFFAAGSLGYSATPDPATFQGLELRCDAWHVEPLIVEEVRSSYFDDEKIFPRGSIHFDNGLLMRDIAHEWHAQADLCCTPAAVCPATAAG